MDLLPHIVYLAAGSEKHRKALDYVMARVKQGRDRRSTRESKWAESEDLFSAYVKETDMDSRRRSRRDLDGVPQYTTVTIPYSYATLMTAHTYWTSVFLSRDPVLQVQGMSGEAQTSEQAVESLLQYYAVAGRNLVPYYIWLLDQGKYGEGIMGMCWDVDRTFIPEVREVPRTAFGVDIPMTSKRVWSSKEVVGYEGLRYFNVRPADFLFDPTVTLQNFQRGEFAGHESFIPLIKLKEGESLGKYYNIDQVEGRATSLRTQNQQRGNTTELPRDALIPGAGAQSAATGVDLIEITVELVPRELGLAPRDYLEKWTFTIANETIIVSAQPQGWYHNEFMYDTLEHEIEGYNTSKRGMMEMLRPLNITLDWLINTHFFNVRKVLNNEFIYDPSILVSKDVENPGPGKLIRVRPEAYGKDIRNSFHQLQVMDVTQNHVRDSGLIVEMMQRLTGVNDTVMGMVNTKRKTATEVRSSSSFAVNRLKTQCEYYSAMGFAPHTSRAIKVSQQMWAGRPQRAMRIVGNASQMPGAMGFLMVGPDEIAGQYDFVPVDGTMPIDRMAQASVFGQLMQQMATIPPVAQQYDFAKLFGWVAQLNGIRNLQQFRVQVVPDGQIPPGNVPINQLPPPPDMGVNNSGIQPGNEGE